jgi:dihydroorotase
MVGPHETPLKAVRGAPGPPAFLASGPRRPRKEIRPGFPRHSVTLRLKDPERERPPSGGERPERIFAGRLYRRGKLVPGEIGVDEEGMIVRVGKDLRGGRRIDFGDRVLLPSALDLHVHFRDPGPPNAPENLEAGTRQAALGGIAAVVDMPNTEPPLSTVLRLEEKLDRIRTRAFVDVLPYALVGDVERVAALSRVASGFKMYLSPTTGVPTPLSEEEGRRALEEVAATHLPLHIHAEDPQAFQTPRHLESLADWDQARPVQSEVRALEGILPGPGNLRLHVAHVTTVEALEAVRAAGASAEATPHHLLLSTAHDRGAWGKVNPPLRSEENRRRLWEAFRQGQIPILASDHAPHAPEEKERPFAEAPSGVPGVETMVPIFLALARRGEIPLAQIVSCVSRRPALFLGLPLGALEEGREASFQVVDFRDRASVQARRLHAPCGWTPFEGYEAIFPQHHYMRGEPLVDDGEFVGASRGRPRRPWEPSPPGEYVE